MGEDWIARSIAIVAAAAAIINSIISYKKYAFDKKAKLPHVAWKVERLSRRELLVAFDVFNTRPFPIEVTAFVVGPIAGAMIYEPLGNEPEGYSMLDLWAEGRGVKFKDAIVPANESKGFRVKVSISDDQPAPHPMRAWFSVSIDLRDGTGADQRFEFIRNV